MQSALKKAIEVRQKAYAPYSKFKVGATVKLKNDATIYTGCNIENASFGGTICAERVAITKALSESHSQEIEYVVVVTDSHPLASPCGICRQVISEFSADDVKIYVADTKEIQSTYSIKQLLPDRFTKSSL